VIQFPGVNCEYETVRACRAAGLEAEILRWNAPLSRLEASQAIVLPGGFSYQDRIRAGVVAAKDRILDAVAKAADRGVPVMGICNGAQILVEGAVVPGFKAGQVELALAPNRMPDRTGYFCTWVRVKRGPADCLFTRFLSGTGPRPGSADGLDSGGALAEDNGTVPVPVAHAEGRFVTALPQVQEQMDQGHRVALTYAAPDGRTADRFPDNPNGSMGAVAGVTNAGGNVLALMPHPERATWLYQVPRGAGGFWGRRRLAAAADDLLRPGPGWGFFYSLKQALD
jgi:phosphoribosylformylglycinamidine synthase